MRWIGRKFIEVDHCVEMPGFANPLVYGDTIGLIRGTRMVVPRAPIRKNGPADNFNPVSVRSNDYLLIRAGHLLNQRFVFGL